MRVFRNFRNFRNATCNATCNRQEVSYTPTPPLERSLQKSVLGHLKKLRAADPTLAYRKRHGSAFTVAGDPDIHGVWRGIPFEFELKQEGEEPTKLQAARLNEWRAAGAFVGVIHNLDELRGCLEKISHLHQV